MKVFLAGASGAIGRRLTPLLLAAGYDVTGATRSTQIARELEAAGVHPAVVDVFDAAALKRAVVDTRPEIVIHQLTDLPRVLNDETQLVAAYPRNARIRIEGTRNLVAAAQAASARRFIVQSVAFAYLPGKEPYAETDPLNLVDGPRLPTVRAAADMEQQVLASGMEAIVLRYGLLYGPGTWTEARKPQAAAARRCRRASPRSSRSRAERPASTTSPTMTAQSRLRKRAKNSASIRRSGCRHSGRRERLTQESRAFLAVAPRQVGRLGNPDARSGDDLQGSLAGKNLERRSVERQPVMRAGDAQRLTDPPGARARAIADRRCRAAAASQQARLSARWRG